MSGAIRWPARRHSRSGAGLVTLAVPRSVQDVVASIEPSYMTIGLADDDGHIATGRDRSRHRLAQNATAVALGPGLGRRSESHRLGRLICIAKSNKPMVVDADALFALAERTAALDETWRAARI